MMDLPSLLGIGVGQAGTEPVVTPTSGADTFGAMLAGMLPDPAIAILGKSQPQDGQIDADAGRRRPVTLGVLLAGKEGAGVGADEEPPPSSDVVPAPSSDAPPSRPEGIGTPLLGAAVVIPFAPPSAPGSPPSASLQEPAIRLTAAEANKNIAPAAPVAAGSPAPVEPAQLLATPNPKHGADPETAPDQDPASGSTPNQEKAPAPAPTAETQPPPGAVPPSGPPAVAGTTPPRPAPPGKPTLVEPSPSVSPHPRDGAADTRPEAGLAGIRPAPPAHPTVATANTPPPTPEGAVTPTARAHALGLRIERIARHLETQPPPRSVTIRVDEALLITVSLRTEGVHLGIAGARVADLPWLHSVARQLTDSGFSFAGFSNERHHEPEQQERREPPGPRPRPRTDRSGGLRL